MCPKSLLFFAFLLPFIAVHCLNVAKTRKPALSVTGEEAHSDEYFKMCPIGPVVSLYQSSYQALYKANQRHTGYPGISGDYWRYLEISRDNWGYLKMSKDI